MNFLAHLFLSGDSDQLMLGNFIADFVKGKREDSYEEKILQGILLHRKIDAFTDRHPQVAKSKQRLWPRHRHYSSVILDIFYDHFLARNWKEYSSMQLEDFAGHAYATILRFEDLLPPRAKQVVPNMIAGNWLVNYAELSGINRALQGMARRASFQTEMAGAIKDLQKEYENFETDFRIFFPELVVYSEYSIKNLLLKGISGCGYQLDQFEV